MTAARKDAFLFPVDNLDVIYTPYQNENINCFSQPDKG
jgi:hypothetical protein